MMAGFTTVVFSTGFSVTFVLTVSVFVSAVFLSLPLQAQKIITVPVNTVVFKIARLDFSIVCISIELEAKISKSLLSLQVLPQYVFIMIG